MLKQKIQQLTNLHAKCTGENYGALTTLDSIQHIIAQNPYPNIYACSRVSRWSFKPHRKDSYLGG